MFTRSRLASSMSLAALLTALWFGPVTAHAAADPAAEAKAKAAYSRGSELYQSKRFSEAAAQFSEGYALKPHPAFLFNMALAYRALGDHQKALDSYKAYLAAAPDAKDRGAVQAAITEQEQLLAATQRRRPAASPALVVAPAPPAPTHAAGTESRPFYKKWWFWTATGAAVAAVGIGLGVGLTQSPTTAPYREVTF